MSGCTCSTPVVFPEGGFPDTGPEDAGRRDGTLLGSCDEVTGEGCPCPAEGDTRSCSTGAVGACGAGMQVCTLDFEFPVWGACIGGAEPSAETCDGTDEDCDGETDEDLGQQTCGIGPCEVTLPRCIGGVDQTCVPRSAGTETCDGSDEDCDGSVDEDLGDVSCGTGACAASVAACTGGVAGICMPGTPGTEVCNGLDDDCDASVDEGLGTTSCGTGACLTSVPACTDGTPGTCVPLTGSTEICNGVDDDCDGTIDEGFGTTVCGVGECRRIVLDCDGGGGMSCTPGTPTAEVCDGLDNDCDGMVDDGIPAVTCGVGACMRTEPGCVGGSPVTCRPGMPAAEICDGIDNDCDGTIDDSIPSLTCGVGACRRTVSGCTGGVPGSCTPGSPVAEVCGNGADDDCNGVVDDLCGCDPRIDRDFDTFNECVDCNDANGAIHPGRAEVCNGIDEDCDGLVDEDFDRDGDTFATCTTNPLLRDCDDTRASVYPGAMEDCGPDGRGNGIDEDCDGYIDDGCAPCTTTDVDGDGVSECGGDCNDADPTISPRLPEQCDGRDTDCNIFTTRNCGVSQPCNFPGGVDVCESDLLCGCVVGASGMCNGNYLCTSFCEGSFTGDLGAGCSATQTCSYRITITDNQHGCAESTNPVGTRRAGEVCTADSECRSLNCDRYCVGPGCSTERCVDYCDHHEPNANGSCATGTVCELVSSAFMSPFMYATCRLDDNGTGGTGASCASGTGCRWGTQSCVSGICAEPCGLESHCPSGYHCSLRGNSVRVGTWGAASPSYISGQNAIETVPVCLTDTGAGMHNRQPGAACTQNGDCSSQFCDRALRVCIGLCTTDASCPTGLSCEPQYVRTAAGITYARVCVSTPIDALLEAM